MTEPSYDLTLVIACYNEEPLLADSVRQTIEVLDCTPWTYEIIFVDDCSQDNTRAIIEQLVALYPTKSFQVIFHRKNRGRGRTVSDGFRAARGDVVGYIDIDLEVHARYIPSMVQEIYKGCDVATALRIYKVQYRLFIRYLLSTGYMLLVHFLLGIDRMDTETGYKFFHRKRLLALLDEVEDEHWFWDTEIMVRSYYKGYKIVEIPCLFVRRYDKESSVNVVSDTLEYLWNLFNFRRTVQQLRKEAQIELARNPQVPLASMETLHELPLDKS